VGHHLTHDGVLEAMVLVLVTSDTGFASHIVAIRSRFGLFLRRRRLGSIPGRRPRSGNRRYAKREDEQNNCEELASGCAVDLHERFLPLLQTERSGLQITLPVLIVEY
jgi:hypothetical protein